MAVGVRLRPKISARPAAGVDRYDVANAGIRGQRCEIGQGNGFHRSHVRSSFNTLRTRPSKPSSTKS